MKAVPIILLLSVLALLGDLTLAGLGLVLVAVVLLIGDLVQCLPDSACKQNCKQGDNCTCMPVKQERQP
jgi:hypothetical protein